MQDRLILIVLGSPTSYVCMSVSGQTLVIFISIARVCRVNIPQMTLSDSQSHLVEAEFEDVVLSCNVTWDTFLYKYFCVIKVYRNMFSGVFKISC